MSESTNKVFWHGSDERVSWECDTRCGREEGWTWRDVVHDVRTSESRSADFAEEMSSKGANIGFRVLVRPLEEPCSTLVENCGERHIKVCEVGYDNARGSIWSTDPSMVESTGRLKRR